MQAQSNNDSTATNALGRVAGPSSAMPPPPVPAAKSVTLEREALALSSCFKASVRSIVCQLCISSRVECSCQNWPDLFLPRRCTQIVRRRLFNHYRSDTTCSDRGIHKYAPHPPRTLTASLGRELERYDQVCDAIESQLVSTHPQSSTESLNHRPTSCVPFQS